LGALGGRDRLVGGDAPVIRLNDTSSSIELWSELAGGAAPDGLKGIGAFKVLCWEHVQEASITSVRTLWSLYDEDAGNLILRITHSGAGTRLAQFKNAAAGTAQINLGEFEAYEDRRVGDVYLDIVTYDPDRNPRFVHRVIGTDGTDQVRSKHANRFDATGVNTSFAIGKSSVTGESGDTIPGVYGVCWSELDGFDHVVDGDALWARRHWADIFYSDVDDLDAPYEAAFANDKVVLSIGHSANAKPGGGAPNEYAYPGATATDENLAVYLKGLSNSIFDTLARGPGGQQLLGVSGVTIVDPYTLTLPDGSPAFNKLAAPSDPSITSDQSHAATSGVVGRLVRGLAPINDKRFIGIGGQSRGANLETYRFEHPDFPEFGHGYDSYVGGFLLAAETLGVAGGEMFQPPPKYDAGGGGRRSRGHRYLFDYSAVNPSSSGVQWGQGRPQSIFGIGRNRADTGLVSNSIPVTLNPDEVSSIAYYIRPDSPLSRCRHDASMTIDYLLAGYPGAQSVLCTPEIADDQAGTNAVAIGGTSATVDLDTKTATHTAVAGSGLASLVVSGASPAVVVGDTAYSVTHNAFGVVTAVSYDGGEDETTIAIQTRDPNGAYQDIVTFATDDVVFTGPSEPVIFRHRFDAVGADDWRGIRLSNGIDLTAGPATITNVSAYADGGYVFGPVGSGAQSMESRINDFWPGNYASGATNYQHEMFRLAGMSAVIYPQSGDGSAISDHIEQVRLAIPDIDIVLWADGITPTVDGETSAVQSAYYQQAGLDAAAYGVAMVNTRDSIEIGGGPQQLTRGESAESQAHRSPYGNLLIVLEFFAAALEVLGVSSNLARLRGGRGRGRSTSNR